MVHEMIRIAEESYIQPGIEILLLKKIRANLLYYLRHPVYAMRNAWTSRDFILASLRRRLGRSKR